MDTTMEVQDMKMILNSKHVWQFTKNLVLEPNDEDKKFIVNGKKNMVEGVMTIYISREIHFHTSGATIA